MDFFIFGNIGISLSNISLILYLYPFDLMAAILKHIFIIEI